MMDQKAKALREKGLESEAKAIENEIKVRRDFLQNVGTTLGDTARRQTALYLARGGYGPGSEQLLQMGVPMEKFAKALRRGEDVGDKFVDTYARATDENIRNLGYAGTYSESLRKATNMNDESIDYLMKQRGMTREEARKEITRTQQEGDVAQAARNLMLETELKLQLGFDELLQTTNPLIDGFNATTIAVTALQTAALAAAAIMGAQAFMGGLRGIAGAGAGGGSLLGTLASGARGLLASAATAIGATAAGTAALAVTSVTAGLTGLTAAGRFATGGDSSNWISDLIGVENWRLGDSDKDEKSEAVEKNNTKSANLEFGRALLGTGYSWDQENGGLMQNGEHVSITDAPVEIKEIVKQVNEGRSKKRIKEQQKNAPKMAIGGLLGSNQMAMVGEAGPEFITGPAKVVGVKETENLLSTVLRNGLGPFTTSNKSSSSRATDALLERNMRDLNDQKEKELEVLDESNTSMADMSVKTKGLSDTFKEFQDVLRDIFGMPDEGIFGTSAGDKTPGGGGGYPRGGPVDPATVAKASKSERGKKAIDYFKEQGWSQEQAAGIVANLMVESGANLQETAVGDRGKAYGIAQWHPDRQAIFKREYGKDIKESSFEEQLKFVQYELQNNEYLAGHRLKQTTSGGEAAYSFDKEYERSSGQHRNLRIAIAEGILEAIKEAKVSEQVAQTSPTAPVATEQNNTTREQNQLMSMNTQAFSTFSDKLSVMIAKLEENNALLNNVKQNTA